MTDYFIWNGVDCRQYGIHVSELPPITIPLERSKQTNVPGRPGSLTQLEGEDVYDDMILTATCFISDPAQIPAIAAWLKGSGTVTFANRTGGYYKARIANQIPFEKVLRGNPHCTFAVNFRCYPFFYADAGDDITITTSGTTITNGQSERQMACAAYLTECLSREKFTLDIFDISENMKLDMDSAGNLITHLKMKGILKSLQRRGRAMLYAFCEDNASNRPTMKRDAFRRKLTDYCKDTKSTIGKAMNILLGFLDQGKNTFSSTELQVSLGLTSVQLKSLCHNIKDKGLTKLIGYENDRPMYALAFEENDAADVAPVKASFRPQTVKHEYSQEVLDRIDELNASTRSPKDRRIGGMLKMHLNRGKVTEVDYINAGYKTHWAKDMKLAEQIGLVKKFNQGCYTIVSDIKPGPSPLNNNQKEIVSAMYQSFGNEAFSSEMVIATLDYTSAHVSAVLHQFTLMKILNCSSDAENKYQYKLTVNPERNPECFVGVA